MSHNHSVGRWAMTSPGMDLAGLRFGKWTVRSFAGIVGQRHRAWNCICDCGFEGVVAGHSLKKSNGSRCCRNCFGPKVSKSKIEHGACRRGQRTREFNIWSKMRDRCNRPSCPAYSRYGGRGIKICERWSDFSNFLSDMGECPSPELSIDRIDNDGNYEPGNCRWATDLEQGNNKSTNVWVEFGGINDTLAGWGRRLGVYPSVIATRIKRLGLEGAFLKPMRSHPTRPSVALFDLLQKPA